MPYDKGYESGDKMPTGKTPAGMEYGYDSSSTKTQGKANMLGTHNSKQKPGKGY